MNKFSTQTETKSNIAVVTVNGRVDSDTSAAFDEELTKIVSGNPRLVLDLKGVDYMSSAGIRAIVKASQAVAKNGGVVKLASVPDLVNSVLYTVGLNQKLNSYASVDEAIASF